METAVYLFTGFLEAGKTKFITETPSISLSYLFLFAQAVR